MRRKEHCHRWQFTIAQVAKILALAPLLQPYFCYIGR